MMIRRTPDEKINFSDSLKQLLKQLFKTAFIARKTYWPNLPNVIYTTLKSNFSVEQKMKNLAEWEFQA